MTHALKTLTERKPTIRLATPRQMVVERLASAAQDLSRKGRILARVEAANEALTKLVTLAYEQEEDGTLANVDPVTYRLHIPAPWGAKGWRNYGLRNWEARTLAAILRHRLDTFKVGQRPPLFVYDPTVNYWTVNMHDYTVLDHALWYLQKSPITVAEWRAHSTRQG
jgi:hypothetical protein